MNEQGRDPQKRDDDAFCIVMITLFAFTVLLVSTTLIEMATK